MKKFLQQKLVRWVIGAAATALLTHLARKAQVATGHGSHR